MTADAWKLGPKSIMKEYGQGYVVSWFRTQGHKMQSFVLFWCEELTHLKRPWCWERLRAEEGDPRGWDGWMASPTQWTWVWVDSGSWRWTGRPAVLRFMGSQKVRYDWPTELNWTEPNWFNRHVLRAYFSLACCWTVGDTLRSSGRERCTAQSLLFRGLYSKGLDNKR